MIKFFVSDLDGTLLNRQHVVSDKNAEAIHRLEEAGIEFMVATGRTYHSARPVLDVHGINCWMINYNGAAVFDQTGQAVQTHAIKDQTVKELIDYFISNNIEHSIMALNSLYIPNRDDFLAQIQKVIQEQSKRSDDNTGGISGLTASQFEAETAVTYDLDDFELRSDNPVLKIMIMDKDHTKLKDYRKDLESYRDLDITSSGPDNLEVTHIQAQKGLAISEYVEERGYTMDNVLAIGDSLNDRSMLKMAGYSYAMDNASDEVKKIAKYTAPSNADDGVSYVIDQILADL